MVGFTVTTTNSKKILGADLRDLICILSNQTILLKCRVHLTQKKKIKFHTQHCSGSVSNDFLFCNKYMDQKPLDAVALATLPIFSLTILSQCQSLD